MKNKSLLIAGTILLLGALFFIATKLYEQDKTSKVETVTKSDTTVLSRDYSPKLGRSGAQVQLVEFLDPECESCRMFYPYVKMLLNEFEGKIELVVRYAPFHGNSIMVVKILEAARKQNRYWETLEILFQHQPEWGSHHHPRPDLIWNYLAEAGLDVEKVRQDMNDPAIDKIIEQDIQDGKALGVTATPSFFINGKPLRKFGYEALKGQIEEELK